ncbi:MAG: hypothetical protein JWQ79_2151 [Mucilaginibacter sp.]|jgi:hypothetical protein|nr:hypothetical protein [Mucilaginibacter sp.]
MTLKIKNIYFSIFSVIILCMVTLLDVKAQAPVNEKAEAKAFVQKFYDWYLPLYNKPLDRKNPVLPDVVALKQKSNYFDEPLRKALLDDAAEQAKSPGEIVGIDFDPFLGAQDNVLGYKLGDVKQVGNKFWIETSFGNHIVAEVKKAGGSWKFTDFIYPANGKMKQFSMLQMLTHVKPNK